MSYPGSYTFRMQDGTVFYYGLEDTFDIIKLDVNKELPQKLKELKATPEQYLQRKIVTFRCVAIIVSGRTHVEYHEYPPCKGNEQSTGKCCNLMDDVG